MNDRQPPSRELDALIDIKVFAARLGISVKTARRKITRGEIASHRIGKLIRIAERDYADYLSRSRNQ
jgi:excisionase family DNA binding protein